MARPRIRINVGRIHRPIDADTKRLPNKRNIIGEGGKCPSCGNPLEKRRCTVCMNCGYSTCG